MRAFQGINTNHHIAINDKHVILRVRVTVGQFTDHFPAGLLECYTGIQNVPL